MSFHAAESFDALPKLLSASITDAIFNSSVATKRLAVDHPRLDLRELSRLQSHYKSLAGAISNLVFHVRDGRATACNNDDYEGYGGSDPYSP